MKNKGFIVLFIFGIILLFGGVLLQIITNNSILKNYYTRYEGIDVNCTLEAQKKKTKYVCKLKNQYDDPLWIEKVVFKTNFKDDTYQENILPLQQTLKAKEETIYVFTINNVREKIKNIKFSYQN